MIKCLSKGVQAKLRSGIAIFSLQQCVEELVLNGIDAGATCIAVRLDMDAFKVQVIDNGSGMAREDLEHVGKRYFTSKCSTLEDLENLQFHGFRGEAVASIASLSTLVEIASRSRLSSKTFVKIFKDGKGMDVFESEINRPSVGTTVVICNFFHNMPVRRKRVDVVLEFERIRHRVEAISLMHPSISFTLKNDCTGTMVVQLPKAKSIYYRFVQIHGMSRAQKLADICCSYGQFEMSGYIGCEGHYNCGLQFLFVNCRLVLKTRIHKLLNFLLKRINLSGRHNGNSGETSTIGSPRHRAGAEVHGVYIINIKCHHSEYDICLEPAKTLIEFKDWDSVLSCVEKGIREFLTRENLVTELSPEDVCKYVNGNYLIEPTGGTSTVDDNAAKTRCNAEEMYDGHKVMSTAVHRILELDSGRTESVQKDYEDNIVNEEPVHRMVVEDFGMTKSVHVPDSYNIVSEGEKKLEIPWKLDSKENGALKGAIITNSFGSETDERVINFDSIAGTSTPKSKHLKCNFEATESHHKVQLENVDDTSFRSSERQHNVSSGPLKGEEQNMYPRECFEVVDYMGLWQSKRHDRKMTEWCGEGQVHDTSLEKPGCEADDLMKTALKLGSVGFIKHVVPQQHNAGELEGSVPGGLSKVLSLGPVSAQDLQPLIDCQSRDYCSTATREPLNYSVNSSNIQDVCRCSSSSVFETKESPILAPKRKLSFLGEPSVIAKALRINPYQKLALSVQTGSLDRFRRMCIKHKKAQCHPLGTADCAELVDSKESLTDGTSVNARRPSFDQSELNETSEMLEVCSLIPSGCCITLSEYTTPKPSVSHSRSSTESIAAKLSQFKQNQVKAKSRAPERPLRETSILISSLDGAVTDTLSLDDCNTEKQICPDLCSAGKVTSDTNTNNQQSQIEAHCDAFDGRESAQMLAPRNLCDFSDEEANFVKKEQSLCCDTTMEQNKQVESIAVGSSDWLEHFDDSIGKLVYINKVTGLSKYEAPAVKETSVPCTTDVTTMSVSVISSNGFESIYYPFQSEIVLPFLPRSKAERVLSSGQDHTDDVKADASISSMFSEWSNPVFARPPEVAVNVTSGQAEDLAVKIHNILYPYRFTKNMIHSMKVVNQVDKKFLACLIHTKDVDTECGNLLVLVDQHAAHERVRLENLIMESYEDDPETPGQRRLCSSSVTPPVEIEVTQEEHRLLRSCQPFLIGLGLELRFAETGDPRLLVGKVPVCFVEREVSELRRGRQSATKAIVEEYIREQIELLQSAGRVRGTLPLTVLKVLASQACHGAVKFNHNLSMEECCSLVGSLSTCQLPFQCAHGRPSMVPLADLLHLDDGQQESPKPNLRKLRQMYRAWELYGKT